MNELPHVDEPVIPDNVMDTGNHKTAFHEDVVSKDRIKQLIAKFPSYPCLAERHPQKIEDFIAAYNAVLKEVKDAVS